MFAFHPGTARWYILTLQTSLGEPAFASQTPLDHVQHHHQDAACLSCMYHADDLRYQIHRSISAYELLFHKVLFDQLGIENNRITSQLASKNDWCTKDGVTTTYSDQRVIGQLNENLGYGLPTFLVSPFLQPTY